MAHKHLKRAAAIVGSQSALARAIGVSPQAISMWLNKGEVPAEYAPSIEDATRGVVRCEELNSRVRWSVLRPPVQPEAMTQA
jgi:DNA-binding transcriptional regulator YdaS (Cro superfamily)